MRGLSIGIAIAGLLLALPSEAMPTLCPSPPSLARKQQPTVFRVAVPYQHESELIARKAESPSMGSDQATAIQSLFSQAEKAYQAQQFTNAESILNQALEQSPQESFIWVKLGDTLRRQKKFTEAKKAYDRAIQLDRKAIKAYEGRALLTKPDAHEIELPMVGVLDILDRDLSIKVHREFLTANPDHEEAYQILGNTLLMRAVLEGKASEFKLSDDQLEIEVNHWVQQYLSAERVQEITELYQEAYLRFPENRSFFGTLVELLQRQGNPDESIQLYRDKIQKDPTEINLQIRLAKFFLRLKRTDEAQKMFCQTLYLQKQEKINPSESLEGLARVLGPKQQTRRVIDLYTKEINSTQDLKIRNSIRHGLAKVLSASERLTDLILVYQDIIKETPDDLFAHLYCPSTLVKTTHFSGRL
jgi:tetratricopeptide (TPR) repeat protein